MVVVVINYRLGVFGYLGAAELRNRTHDNSTGNWGTHTLPLRATLLSL